ncbi:MAG TPA: FAD-dependent oxidoreductase [Microbacterium sp.]|nr:FAD-dependent oxidoreductase [Microbacterium sp.]
MSDSPQEPSQEPSSLWLQTAAPIATDTELPQGSEVVVAGAGLTGIVTALLLARRGIRVTVVEARQVGAVTTGHTTGKLSLLQGASLGEIREQAGERALLAYAAGNLQAQAWVIDEVGDSPAIAQQVLAGTYATSLEGDDAVAREREALRACGLEVGTFPQDQLPFPVSEGISMAGQWQLHPMRLLRLLVDRLREHGGRVVEGCRVVGADVQEHTVRVQTDRGDIECAALVLATGVPILDRGLFFAKLVPSRAFVGAYACDPERLPRGIHLSVDERSRSLRTAQDPNGETLLLVGSEGFTPGRPDSTREVLDGLDEWTVRWFPGARRVTWWAAQDYRSVSRLPYAGRMPRGGDRVYVATGYAKWGMTNAVAAGHAIAGEIAGDTPEWAAELARERPVLAAGDDAIAANAQVAGELAKGWAAAETSRGAAEAPADGEGRVMASGLRPIAESSVDGVVCRVSAVCTHLGGIVQWNDAERTWDCPLHGSRFDPSGRLLEGPAVRDLARE